MKKFLTILFVTLSFSLFGQNTVKAIYVPDIARDWVQFTTTASAGTMPSTSAFTVNGVTPSAIVKTNDTLVSLKMASSFTMGQSVSVNYTAPGGGEIGGLATFTAREADNQITAGVVHNWTTTGHDHIFSPYGNDFNTDYGIDSGDIVVLAPGNYHDFDVMRLTGVRFVGQYSATGDSVLFTYFNVREETVDVGLYGHPAMPSKQIKIRNTYGASFGIGCFATGWLDFENIEIYNLQQGIQVKTVSDLAFHPYDLSRRNYQHLTTKYISVHHTSEEAFYIGSDVAAPLIPISWTGFGLSVDSVGRDAYQYRNGNYVWLKNCTMTHIGLGGNLVHAHGFLMGTTTQGGYIENITGSNILGNGILANGYGTLTIKNCQITSDENTVYIKNYDDHDEYSMGGLTVNFICTTNSFDCTNALGYALDARRDADKTNITLNINSATTFSDPNYIENMPVEEFPPSSGLHRGGIVVNYTTTCAPVRRYGMLW